MLFVKQSLVRAIILSFLLTDAGGAATPPLSALDPRAVVVEASGNVPGFTPAQLEAYLAKTMGGATAAWHFSAGKPGAGPPPYRVVWSFRTLRVEWKGGSHRGFSSPANRESYLSAEVKLYLGDVYQTTMLTQPTVSGGPDDRDFSEMVRNVTHALFVENRPDTP